SRCGCLAHNGNGLTSEGNGSLMYKIAQSSWSGVTLAGSNVDGIVYRDATLCTRYSPLAWPSKKCINSADTKRPAALLYTQWAAVRNWLDPTTTPVHRSRLALTFPMDDHGYVLASTISRCGTSVLAEINADTAITSTDAKVASRASGNPLIIGRDRTRFPSD